MLAYDLGEGEFALVLRNGHTNGYIIVSARCILSLTIDAVEV